MSIELAIDNTVMPETAGKDIAEILRDYCEDYADQNGGVWPTIIEAGIHGSVYFILATVGKPKVTMCLGHAEVDTPTEQDKMLYTYGTAEWSCSWDSYAEIGEPYKNWFQSAMQLIAREWADDKLLADLYAPDKPPELVIVPFGSVKVGDKFTCIMGCNWTKTSDTRAQCSRTECECDMTETVDFRADEGVTPAPVTPNPVGDTSGA